MKLINLGIVCIIHIAILFTIAPMIDHAFTPLHKDETNTEILFEIITQLLTICVVWYILESYVLQNINKYFGVHNVKIMKTITDILSAIILIGLQSHLINKLEYITHEHPFRVFSLFDN